MSDDLLVDAKLVMAEMLGDRRYEDLTLEEKVSRVVASKQKLDDTIAELLADEGNRKHYCFYEAIRTHAQIEYEAAIADVTSAHPEAADRIMAITGAVK